MTTRNTLLAVIAAALLAAGIWWFSQSAPVPVTTKAATTPTAPATPAPKVAAPVVPPKSAVTAPLAPPIVPSAQPKPVETPTPSPDADLNTAVNDLITALESQDANAVMQVLAPSMLESAKKAALSSLAQNPNMTPAMQAQMQAQMDRVMAQQATQMIQQSADRLAQNPSELQGYQKLGDALKKAQGTPPTMNEAGDQATYTLDMQGVGSYSPKVVMTLRDGKWTPDFSTMNLDLVVMQRNAAASGQ
jgi:hypothetical protein